MKKAATKNAQGTKSQLATITVDTMDLDDKTYRRFLAKNGISTRGDDQELDAHGYQSITYTGTRKSLEHMVEEMWGGSEDIMELITDLTA